MPRSTVSPWHPCPPPWPPPPLPESDPPSVLLAVHTTSDNTRGASSAETLSAKTSRLLTLAMAASLGQAAQPQGPGATPPAFPRLVSSAAGLDFYSIQPGNSGHTVRMFAPRHTVDRLISGGLTTITVRGGEDSVTGATGLSFSLVLSAVRTARPEELDKNKITIGLDTTALIKTPAAALGMLRALELAATSLGLGMDHGPVMLQRACGAFDSVEVTKITESEALDFIMDQTGAPLSSTDVSGLPLKPWKAWISCPRQIDACRLIIFAHMRLHKAAGGATAAPETTAALGHAPSLGFDTSHRFGALPPAASQPGTVAGAVGGPVPLSDPGARAALVKHSMAGLAQPLGCAGTSATSRSARTCAPPSPPPRSPTRPRRPSSGCPAAPSGPRT